MSVGTTAAIVAAGIGAAGSITSSVIGANAAGNAASQQTNAENQALQFQQQVYGTQQANEAPYVSAGQTSIGNLMGQLQNGTFGAGSNPTFTAPTAAQAAATPGYQFTLQQGERGVDAGAAARGGALSGGAIKASDQYAQGLASTTYGQTFNQSLAAYQANLANQAQEFGQESTVAQLGQQGISAVGNAGTGAATNVGNIMSQIGNAQAAGTVGTANAINQGIGGATNAVSQGIILSQLPNIYSSPGYSTAIGNGGPPIPSSYAPDGTALYGA